MVAPRKTSMDFSRGDAGDNADDAAEGDDIRRVSRRNRRGAASIDEGKPERVRALLTVGPGSFSTGSAGLRPTSASPPKSGLEVGLATTACEAH